MLCQLGPRGASSDAGAQRTTRDKYDASVGCSAAKGPGRLRDDRLFSSDDITILVHGKWGLATTELTWRIKPQFRFSRFGFSCLCLWLGCTISYTHRINEINRKPAYTVTELASARQHQKTGRHRCTERRVSVRNAFADGVCTFESRNGPNGVRKRRCRVSRSSAAHARLCAPSPSSCLAVFVEIAGGNRVRCFSTIDLVVIINHTGRFARVFAHACAYTTARPHDRTTARPHDRTTARPHDRTTARRPRNIAAFRAFARPLLLKMTNRNGKRKRETETRSRSVLLCWPTIMERAVESGQAAA